MPDRNGTLYLNLIWHQHQPLYLDPELDQLRGPWVRTHGTKDYYDMASMLEGFPGVHCTFNLTSSLLQQLQSYYIDRLRPFVDVRKNRVDDKGFLRAWKGKTDPWIDLLLKPSGEFDEDDRSMLLFNPWNALYITDVMMARFPEYKALKEKRIRAQLLSEQELREIKFWFFLAYFDPDFLNGRVVLADGIAVDLTDLVEGKPDGTYVLRKTVTETDCNRILAEVYKVLSNIIPIHKKLMYDPDRRTGQLEVTTTPYYHPILPLIYDSDVARTCQPDDTMPSRFTHPEDADVQVAKAVEYFREMFGRRPAGMWPAEGSVSQDSTKVFSSNKILWIATDEKILAHSRPVGLPKYQPYNAGMGGKESVAIVFRDTGLSDKIGFTYQHYRGMDAAKDFVADLLQRSPPAGEPDRLVTVVVDGENAWEWYRYDNDGKEFLRSLYGELSVLGSQRRVLTVTMSEYILGNESRGVPAHPASAMKRLDWLYPGSWINANFSTWIGSGEKNRAWEYLLAARNDLAQCGLAAPDPRAGAPAPGTKHWNRWKAWEEMYAAEGSDWFWWYGSNTDMPSVVAPFESAFLTHLRNVYRFASLAGGKITQREFQPIRGTSSDARPSQGAMARG